MSREISIIHAKLKSWFPSRPPVFMLISTIVIYLPPSPIIGNRGQYLAYLLHRLSPTHSHMFLQIKLEKISSILFQVSIMNKEAVEIGDLFLANIAIVLKNGS